MSAVPVAESPAGLVLRRVSKNFVLHGETLPVLEGIDLEARPGSFTAIVGASGCGKSTLLRLIVGLDADYQGEILFDGAEVRAPGRDRGIVFQDHRLFPWLTVEQNVALGLAAAKLEPAEVARRVEEHLALVGLEGFARAFPHQLSGGMAQRAAIARALIARPQILVLDEPLGALDALTRLHLQIELQRLWAHEGITMILVTHDIEEALFLGERVLVMEPRPGRIRRRIDVPLSFPRDRASEPFLRLKRELLAEFSVR
jgi:ABC-type nitrate/sulfonate/bicarbonate transport system ATPase subunit